MGEHRRHEESHNPLGRIEEKLERLEDAVEIMESVVADLGSKVVDLDSKIDQILGLLTQETPATGFLFQNTGDNSMPTNFTVTPGQPFQITASIIPAGATLQAVPVWTCDDASVTLTPDATGLVLNGTTLATDAAPSFNLTLTGVNSAGATISNTQNMAFTAAPPPLATGFSFVQNS